MKTKRFGTVDSAKEWASKKHDYNYHYWEEVKPGVHYYYNSVGLLASINRKGNGVILKYMPQ